MAFSGTSTSAPTDDIPQSPTWTYPTRFCRICREDVPPTVTMYPPGLPPSFQRPIVEYKNEDEYGRLIKPCLCRGGMRYIHELCLLRSRTETNRAGSMHKCHTCGYNFNFQKLAIQRFLSSKYSSGFLTVMVMLIIMFVLGFIADPIINLYVDPYETVVGRESIWSEVKVRAPISKQNSGWAQHFVKGLVSMGLVGFLKTLFLNPFQWWNLRSGGLMGSRSSSSTTGRDRAVNISWIAVFIGVSSAFYFFYRWVQTIIQRSLQRIGNNIVDTSLPDDDDDLKPPSGWKPTGTPGAEPNDPTSTDDAGSTETSTTSSGHIPQNEGPQHEVEIPKQEDDITSTNSHLRSRKTVAPNSGMTGSWFVVDDDIQDAVRSSALDEARTQGWSFSESS